MKKIKIKNKFIGDNYPIFFIAEAGVNHNGSMKYAKKLIDIANKNWCSPVHWLTTITVNKINLRNRLIHFLTRAGIDARSMINPVHEALHFKKYFNKKNFNNSLQISKNSLHLPSSTNLKEKQIKFICNKIKLFFSRKR